MRTQPWTSVSPSTAAIRPMYVERRDPVRRAAPGRSTQSRAPETPAVPLTPPMLVDRVRDRVQDEAERDQAAGDDRQLRGVNLNVSTSPAATST